MPAVFGGSHIHQPKKCAVIVTDIKLGLLLGSKNKPQGKSTDKLVYSKSNIVFCSGGAYPCKAKRLLYGSRTRRTLFINLMR